METVRPVSFYIIWILIGFAFGVGAGWFLFDRLGCC